MATGDTQRAQIEVYFARGDHRPAEAAFSVHEAGCAGQDGGGEWVDELKERLIAALRDPSAFDGNQRKKDLA